MYMIEKFIMVIRRILLVFFCLIASIGVPQNGDAAEKLVSLIQKVKPSIVAVGTYYFNDVPKLQFRGTGFAVGDGTLIITNAHTITRIEEENKLKQLRIFNQKLESKGIKVHLIEKDEAHDLALLKIESGAILPLEIGDSSSVREGETVAFTGYPLGLILGLNPTTHMGIISAIAPIVLPSPNARAIEKEIVKFLRQPYDIFQLDATAYPGNSGSPVFRVSSGEVIGVINMVFVKGKKEHLLKEPTGITYAIPGNFIRLLLSDSDLSSQ